MVQVFIHCRMDYCNALLAGIADTQMKQLQPVQNTAARLVWQRVIIKTPGLVLKCIHGVAPAYLQEFENMHTSIQGRPRLRSVSTGRVELPRVRMSVCQRSYHLLWIHCMEQSAVCCA